MMGMPSQCQAWVSTSSLGPRARAGDRLSLPELLRWDAERPVEARGRVLPRDDHRQLRNGVVVIVLLQAREQLVVDIAVCFSTAAGPPPTSYPKILSWATGSSGGPIAVRT